MDSKSENESESSTPKYLGVQQNSVSGEEDPGDASQGMVPRYMGPELKLKQRKGNRSNN
jgi:hypothetical protein